MMKNVLLASFNADNSLSYSINYAKQEGAKCDEETIYILDGEQVDVEKIRKFAERFATPASIDVVNGKVVRLEITTK